MKTPRNTKSATDNRPTAQAVNHAWYAYDAAMNSGKSTAKCQELHRTWKTLYAERHGF